jgi:hypothetical protein
MNRHRMRIAPSSFIPSSTISKLPSQKLQFYYTSGSLTMLGEMTCYKANFTPPLPSIWFYHGVFFDDKHLKRGAADSAECGANPANHTLVYVRYPLTRCKLPKSCSVVRSHELLRWTPICNPSSVPHRLLILEIEPSDEAMLRGNLISDSTLAYPQIHQS